MGGLAARARKVSIRQRLFDALANRAGLTLTAVYRAPLRRQYPPAPAGLRVALAEREQLTPYLDRPGYDLPAAFVEDALGRGAHCVASWLEGELAAYGWVSYGPTRHLGDVFVHFAPGHRYNFKSYTVSRYRGAHLRGSYGALSALDAAKGVTHSIAFIALGNDASIRAEARNGGVRVGYAGYWEHPFGTWCFASRGARRYGFAFRVGTVSGQ